MLSKLLKSFCLITSHRIYGLMFYHVYLKTHRVHVNSSEFLGMKSSLQIDCYKNVNLSEILGLKRVMIIT
jgi:hypothetical protein